MQYRVPAKWQLLGSKNYNFKILQLNSENRNIIILVCCSPQFHQIPVGTIGLSNHLTNHGIDHKVVHSHLQSMDTLKMKLESWVSDGYHFALVLHWKENTDTFFELSSYLLDRLDDRKRLVCGGITASFFHEEILKNPQLPDVVFRGDPESPFLMYGKGEPFELIPNIAYMDGVKPTVKPIEYVADAGQFSNQCFTNYQNLENARDFLAKVNELFIHVPISRGCAAQCTYCGGSKAAYMEFSGRHRVLARPVEKVVRDIEMLYSQMKEDHDFIHLHFDDFFGRYFPIISVLTTKDFVSRIKLYITERGFLKPSMIEEAEDIFRHFESVTIEISPETDDDEQRKLITLGSGKANYTLQATKALVEVAETAGINLWIYYSFFNQLDTRTSLAKRIDFLDEFMNYLNEKDHAHLILHSIALDSASADYHAQEDPPLLSDYRRGGKRFSRLLGNITIVDSPEKRHALMVCKFFIEAMRNKKTWAVIKQEVDPDYEKVERIVLEHGLEKLAYNEAIDSIEYMSFILEELEHRKNLERLSLEKI